MNRHSCPQAAHPRRVTVIGAGYVGLTASVCFAALGHRVTCVEHNPHQLRRLLAGEVPIHEPGVAELLADGVGGGRVGFTGDAGEAVPGSAVAVLCVGTPARPDGHPDLRQIASAAAEVAAAATGDLVIVVKSTVPPGSCEAIEVIAAESAPAGVRVTVVSNPEFLRESQAVDDFFNPDRVVIGSEDGPAGDLVASLYPATWPLLRCDRRSSELIKYASNTFLALKISFANEISGLCEQAGADARSVLAGVGADRRIGSSFLAHGPGFGGSCLGKDLTGLIATADALGSPAPVARAAAEVNRWARGRVIDRLEAIAGPVTGQRIALLGLAFKPGTDDVRDSPAVSIAEGLLARGAHVSAFDPIASEPKLGGIECRDAYAAARGATAVIFATGWPEFGLLDLARLSGAMSGHLLFDLVGVVDAPAAAAVGLELETLGRGTPTSFHPVVVPPLESCLDVAIA